MVAALAAAGAERVSRNGDEEAARYALEAVDGFGRVPLVGVKPEAVADRLPEAVAAVGRLAHRFREQGALGRLELVDRATGAVLVRRRVWP